MCDRTALSLRQASAEDAELLLSWRNDPRTRRWAFNTDEVALSEHEAWLQAKLAAASSVIWIAECEGEAVGQIRLDKVDESSAVVDISVASAKRGHGIGARMLEEAGRRAPEALGVTRLLARIKADNAASLGAFSRAGFGVTAHGEVVEMERPLRPDQVQ